MSPAGTLQPGPWLKTSGWRGGSFLVGIVLMLLFADWLLGDRFEVGWSRPLLVALLGFLFSIPYGWAWTQGRAPVPPLPAALVPQAAVQQGERGNTYVVVGNASSRLPGMRRQVRDLGPIAWFLYTVFWRWPVVLGDAVLTLVWRGITRIFGFNNGGPRVQSSDRRQVDEVDRPEDLPRPDRERF